MLEFFGYQDAFGDGVNSSAFLRDDDSILIIDTGENTFSTISKYIKDNNIKNVNIALTHLHSDHVGGLSTLIYWLHFIRDTKPAIYAPNGIYEDVKRILDIADNKEDQYKLINMHEDRYLYCVPNMKVAIGCVETEHKDDMNCYGYIIKDTRKLVYYSGDSYSVPKSIMDSINDFNTVYQDVCPYDFDTNPHMHAERLGELYGEEHWCKIVAYHYSDRELLDNRFKELGIKGISFAEIFVP